MEEESVASTLPHPADPAPQQEDSWTSIDHRCLNGEQQAIAWDETEVRMSRSRDSDQLGGSAEAGRDSPEDAEQWEQIVWPVRPMTCTSPPLSFATVQWDTPDPGPETGELEADGGADPADATPLPLHQSEDVFAQEIGGEEGGFDVKPLNPGLERTGSGSEPCDEADVQEPATQEKEESTRVLLDGSDEIPSRRCSPEEEEEGDSETSDPVETVDLDDILEEAASSEDGADSFVDLKLEEEQEEQEQEEQGRVSPSGREEEHTPAQGADAEGGEEGAEVEEEREEQAQALPSGQGDSVEEQTATQGVETEGEEEEEEEEVGVKNHPRAEESEEAEAFSCPSDAEAPAEPLHTDNTAARDHPDQPSHPSAAGELLEEGSEDDIEIVERFHDHLAGQTQELDMCEEDVDRNADPEEAEATLDADPADDAEKNSEEVEEKGGGDQEESGCEPERIQAEEEHLEPPMESTEESTQPQATEGASEESTVSEQEVHGDSGEDPEQTEPPSREDEQTNEETKERTDESGASERPPAETQAGTDRDATMVANGGQRRAAGGEPAAVLNGGQVEREMARELAQRLFKLDGIQRVDVVKHLDKDHDFSRAVGEEYLRFFDFAGQPLDHALRSFLKVVVLIGETQERERVLQHFAQRFHQCNPASFSSSGSVLALTCALMLLNTDLHGQNVGKSMSSSKFVSNLDGMNEGENFNKDLLKSLYNSIKSEPLEWAVDEEELKSKVLVDEDAAEDAPLRSKANPFQDVPHDKKASVVKEGFLQRKLHADIDGKRTPWGKRGWKTFYGVLKGMVLYLQKDDIRREQPTNEEVVSVHHSLAEPAADYTKKPHVFRLQTADWRVFLFQASSRVEMNSWISRINLVSALHSSPPFPAAVGSQRRFFRPILPASQSAHTLERQLQSHAGMLESFKADLSYLQEKPPEGKKAKAKELEEHRVRGEYLHYEMCRYETYIQVLGAWKRTGDAAFAAAALSQFDRAVGAGEEEEEEEEGLKKAISSPSLETESPRPAVVKVRRNISERRTYRRTIIPRWNREA